MRLISRAVVATVIILVIFASEATAQIRVHDDPWSLLPETFCLGGTEIEIVIGVDQVNVVNIVLGCLEIDYPFDWVDVVPVPPAQDQAYPPTTTPPNAPAQDKSRGQGPPSDSHGCGIACSGVGNPINTASLNKYQNEVDFVGPGQLPLRISRHYNSLWADASVNNGRFGQGWSSNLGERLVAIQIPPPNDPNPVYNVLIENETGYRYRITSTDNSKWTTTEGRAVNFKWDEVNETFTLFEDGLTKIFLKSGFLEIVTHSSGETLEYEYKNGTTWGELESIVHSNGSTMTFTYDFALRVKTVTDPGGFVYTYNYDSNNNLASVIHPHVAAYGSAASTGKTTYHYEDSSFPSALTGKSYNVNGFPRRFSTYAYTGSGQATSTGNGNGSINSFTVNTSGNQGYDIQRTITNPNGKFLMYRFDVIADVPRLRDVTTIADATTPATTQLWTYDANGRYDLVTDAEGNVVDYDFGDDGLLASMTSGFGTADARQTTYEWDPVYRKQTKITTPLLTTDIELDGSGEPRKITQTNTSTFGASQAPRIWNIDKTKYSLSSINQQIEIDGPLAGTDDKTTYLFDPSGRLTSIVVAVSANDSLTTTFSNYDAYGRVGTITYPSGLVERYDYHPRGYVLRKRETVGADVRTTNYEYRESGDLRQITRPDGSELLFSYDPYFRLIKTTWADGDSNYNDDIFKTFVYDPANNLTREQAYQRVSSWIDDPNCNPPWWEPEPCSQIQVWADQLTFDRDYDYDSLSRLTEIDYFGSYRKVNYGYNVSAK